MKQALQWDLHKVDRGGTGIVQKHRFEWGDQGPMPGDLQERLVEKRPLRSPALFLKDSPHYVR